MSDDDGLFILRIIAGREVCETLEELVDPAATAVVLVDFQNDFIGAGGLVERRGEAREARTRGLLANTVRVVRRAREINVPIVYLRYCRTADHRFESAGSLRWMVVKRGYSETHASAVEGTWGAQIVDALAPLPGDAIVDKRKASGFVATDLDRILREKGVHTAVLCGVSTHGCVEATARDAESRDYYVVVLEDCVGAYDDALHQAALVVLDSRYEVTGSAELLNAWSSSARSPAS